MQPVECTSSQLITLYIGPTRTIINPFPPTVPDYQLIDEKTLSYAMS